MAQLTSTCIVACFLFICRHARGAEEGTPEDFSVFDALRDTIYSEVAAVIAGNEGRPHFLVSKIIDILDYVNGIGNGCIFAQSTPPLLVGTETSLSTTPISFQRRSPT